MTNANKIVKAKVAKQVDGLEMGVFEDGSTYLSERALASLCGIHRSTLAKHAEDWASGERESRFSSFLAGLGYGESVLCFPVQASSGTLLAYPEPVCMAMLEYCAFMGNKRSVEAENNYRLLARASLRLFVYGKTGYDPANQIPDGWRNYHERLALNAVPPGYFSVHKELADLVLFAIQNGLTVDDRTIPDISVGTLWTKEWVARNGDARHGERRKFDHVYPDSHRQAAAGTLDVWVYPVAALGEFRTWLHGTYIPEAFPGYLDRKVKQQILPASSAELILVRLDEHAALQPRPAVPALGPKK